MPTPLEFLTIIKGLRRGWVAVLSQWEAGGFEIITWKFLIYMGIIWEFLTP